jgi:hypothetical protein
MFLSLPNLLTQFQPGYQPGQPSAVKSPITYEKVKLILKPPGPPASLLFDTTLKTTHYLNNTLKPANMTTLLKILALPQAQSSKTTDSVPGR